ncbi:hypothetical protein STAPHY8AQ_21136 [Staphylococcus sp. 8AQ]|nr:hypothetical protein STAPHY8AQ_21136 [Staphylococcus sp. 8AQ]
MYGTNVEQVKGNIAETNVNHNRRLLGQFSKETVLSLNVMCYLI